MLERRPCSVQDFMENALIPTVETVAHRKQARRALYFLSIEVQGLGPWRGSWGSAPTLLCFIGR